MRSEAFTRRAALWAMIALEFIGIGCSQAPVVPVVNSDLLDRATTQLILEARRAASDRPSLAIAWGRYGQVLHSAEFFSEASLCYRRAAELEPGSIRWWHLLGLVELQLSEDAALDHLARAADLAGDTLDISRLRLAQALIERGRLDEAAQNLERLLALKPQHAGALLESGRLQLLKGDPARAAERLQPCLTNAFTSRPALLLLAQAQQRQGRGDLATRMSQRAASMARPFDWPDPFLREVQSLRVGPKRLADQANTFLMQHRFKEAREMIAKLRTEFPGEPEGVLLSGRLFYLEKECGDAEETFRRYLSLEPESLNGRMQLALALLCQQKWTEAISMLREVISLKPDFAQAHSNLGVALVRTDDSLGATTAFESALGCNPADVNALTWLTELALGRQDRAGARRYWERARELNPEDEKVRRLAERIGSSADPAR